MYANLVCNELTTDTDTLNMYDRTSVLSYILRYPKQIIFSNGWCLGVREVLLAI